MPKQTNFTMEELMQAHQFLYYVQATPVWSDVAYDRFCKAHGLEGSGGSDMADSYPHKVRSLAAQIAYRPDKFYSFIPSS